MSWKELGIAVMAGILAYEQVRAQSKPAAPAEQVNFSTELSVVPVSKPTTPKKEIMQLLGSDSLARRVAKPCRTETGTWSTEMQTEWFIASEIHLDGLDETDFVIRPKNRCLSGVNVGPFWVARETAHGYRLGLEHWRA